MASLIEELSQVHVKVGGDWRFELPSAINLGKGDRAMLPFTEGWAIIGANRVGSFVDRLFAERFGGFDSTDRFQLALRSWVFGHACRLRAVGPRLFELPESLRGLVGRHGDLRLYVQEGDAGRPTSSAILGCFKSSVDEAGRASIPPALARYLGDEPVALPSLAGDSVLVMGGEPALSAYVDRLFENKFGGFDPESRDQALLRRALLDSARYVPLQEGALLGIPRELAERSALQESVVVLGAGDYVEIMSLRRWEELCAAVGKECGSPSGTIGGSQAR